MSRKEILDSYKYRIRPVSSVFSLNILNSNTINL